MPITIQVHDLPLFLGMLAGLLSTLAYIPYLVDTVTGRTVPQRASWFIWSVLSTVAFFSQAHEGAAASLWFAGVQTVCTSVIFLASIRFGTGGLVCRRDCVVLALSGVGLGIWAATDSAVYALAITISISLLGGAVTVMKAYRAPRSETTVTWLLSLVASVCAMRAVDGLDPVLMAYPAYLFVLNAAILGALLLGRTRRQPMPALG